VESCRRSGGLEQGFVSEPAAGRVRCPWTSAGGLRAGAFDRCDLVTLAEALRSDGADLLDLDLDLVDGSLLAFLGLARPLPVLAVAGLAEAEAATPAVVHDAEGRERPAGAAR